MPRRSRRPGNRTKGGRPALPRDPVVTTELLDHRARMAPGIPTEDLMKQRAGIPIEILAAMPCPDRGEPFRKRSAKISAGPANSMASWCIGGGGCTRCPMTLGSAPASTVATTTPRYVENVDASMAKALVRARPRVAGCPCRDRKHLRR
jgi:hypothetical protein